MKRLILTAFIFKALALSAQITENTLITDRPDQTESPNAIRKGFIQIESGFLFERSRLARNLSQHRNVYPTNLFRIGLAEKLELRIVNEVVTYKTINNITQKEEGKVSGAENLQVGLKYQFTENDSRVVIGAKAHVVVPTGSKGISNELYGFKSRLLFSYGIADNKSLSANIGYDNERLDLNNDGLVRYANGNLTYTLAYGVSLSKRVGMYAEVFGDYVEFENWENNMDAGLTYLISDNIQLDYSYGWGLNRVMNYHSVGISMRLPK